jgi:hypothetical protein
VGGEGGEERKERGWEVKRVSQTCSGRVETEVESRHIL